MSYLLGMEDCVSVKWSVIVKLLMAPRSSSMRGYSKRQTVIGFMYVTFVASFPLRILGLIHLNAEDVKTKRR